MVWTDGRGGASTGWDIYGQWINAAGTMDGSNFPICTAGNTQTKPALTYDDQNQRFLVVWQDGRIFLNNDIFGRIIKADGSFLTADFQIRGDALSLNQTSPAVAFDSVNQRYLVVWDEGPLMGTTDIYGSLVGADGNTPNPAFGIATDPTKREETPDVAYDPIAHRFLVVYSNNLAIWGALLKGNGLPEGSNFPIGNHTNDSPRVAYDHRNQKYLAVWSTVMITAMASSGNGSLPPGTWMAPISLLSTTPHIAFSTRPWPLIPGARISW